MSRVNKTFSKRYLIWIKCNEEFDKVQKYSCNNLANGIVNKLKYGLNVFFPAGEFQ